MFPFSRNIQRLVCRIINILFAILTLWCICKIVAEMTCSDYKKIFLLIFYICIVTYFVAKIDLITQSLKGKYHVFRYVCGKITAALHLGNFILYIGKIFFFGKLLTNICLHDNIYSNTSLLYDRKHLESLMTRQGI